MHRFSKFLAVVHPALIVTLGLTVPMTAYVAASTKRPQKVTLITLKISADRHELNQFREAGYDIAGVDLDAGIAQIIMPQSEATRFLKSPSYTVTASQSLDIAVAPDSGYKTPAEVETLLHQFATNYPAIARLESIGRTHEGRDIWAIKISDNPEVHETDEPAVFFNGMHHAREVMSVEVPLDTIEYLLTQYGSQDDVTRWVDNTEIWVLPMLNPDGNSKVWSTDNLWRKNTNNNYGIDINRNYPYGWNSCDGSSSSTDAQDYRGPSPGSELETQAMMRFIERIQPVFSISYHSYSEMVLYPYGCRDQRTATQEIVEATGRAMADLLPKEFGSGKYRFGTPWELLYNADGGDMDWMYHTYNVIAYAIEVNGVLSGFQPPYSRRQPTVEKLRAAWSLLLDKAHSSGIRGIVTSSEGRALSDVLVSAQSLTAFPLLDMQTPVNWRVKMDGTYHLVLPPGTYQLTFERSDRTSIQREVTIGNQLERMDIAF